jgi:hypothetical protein
VVDSELSKAVEQLAELICENQPCVVLTGAGVSTASGIPDFRSPSGIWAQYDPMEYATIDAFLADPAKVWDFYGKRLAVLGDAEPNAGHLALAELEERGWVQAVVTQNIDRLHERPARAVSSRCTARSARRAVSAAARSSRSTRWLRCCRFRSARAAAAC